MWTILFVCVITFGIVVFGIQVNRIADGLFHVDNVEKCENADQYPIDFELKKRKINRTHDGFNLITKLPEAITTDWMIRLESYDKCDGGWKKSDVIGPSFACKMVEDYARDMFETALEMAGRDPPQCPVAEGPLEIHDMVLDYNKLLKRAMEGEKKTKGYLIKNGTNMGCFIIYTTFTRFETDD